MVRSMCVYQSSLLVFQGLEVSSTLAELSTMPGTQNVTHSISEPLLHIEADTVRVPSVPTQPLTSAWGKDVYFLPDASRCPGAQAGKISSPH